MKTPQFLGERFFAYAPVVVVVGVPCLWTILWGRCRLSGSVVEVAVVLDTASTDMNSDHILDLDALDRTERNTQPYEYIVVPNFIREPALSLVQADYPRFGQPGSIPLSQLTYGPFFKRLIEALDGEAFERAISQKFHVELSGKPTMFTVRARCRASDGKIHTDSATKIITVLLYLNDATWPNEGGRLRILRSDRLDEFAAEVPPDGGTLLAFRRSDHSYHGHESYEGPRRAIQMNWVRSRLVVGREQFRHKISTMFKRMKV